MITDEILEAYDMFCEMTFGENAHHIVRALREMLCDFDEFRWISASKEERVEWIEQFLN